MSESESDNQSSVEESPTPSNGGPQDLAAITDNIIDSMPEVQPHAVEGSNDAPGLIGDTEGATIPPGGGVEWGASGAPTDREGNTFDPALHAVDGEGKPKLSKAGNLQKKRGRKSIVGGPTPTEKGQSINAQATARVTGTASAAMLIQVGMVLGGDEWKPRVDTTIGLSESDMLSAAFAEYYLATGKTDVPPGLALSLAVSAYVMPRFAMPKTQTRIGRLKQWFVAKMVDRKLKKYNLKTAKRAEETKETNEDG